jgi:hypothetical protein
MGYFVHDSTGKHKGPHRMSVKHERKTAAAMIRLFCRAHHRRGDLCEQCVELLQYADARLAACPFGGRKPACRKCPVHCYRKEMKERITEVMRWSGPRMMIHHPVMAFRHLLRENMPSRAGGDKGR